ncbi:hypothetical protein CF8_0100 [Aeromonas phage CF8]|nr:hypothetical protein CF8_0100 [Aeromonas phage CF8]
MAKDFRHARFGLVPIELTDARMEGNEQILKSFLKTFNTFSLLSNADSHAEVFSIAKEYIGDDFRNWCYVNFRMGSGARKELVRKMVGYINGTISFKSINGQLRQDFNKLNIARPGTQIQVPIIYDEYDPRRDQFKVEGVDFSNIEDRHLYDILAAMGPELTAKFLLSLDGVYYE